MKSNPVSDDRSNLTSQHQPNQLQPNQPQGLDKFQEQNQQQIEQQDDTQVVSVIEEAKENCLDEVKPVRRGSKGTIRSLDDEDEFFVEDSLAFEDEYSIGIELPAGATDLTSGTLR